MKKLAAILIALGIMMIVIVGCQKTGNQNSGDQSSQPTLDQASAQQGSASGADISDAVGNISPDTGAVNAPDVDTSALN